MAIAPVIGQTAGTTPQTAQNQDKDERALAALDKAVDYYGKPSSFSLAGREVLIVDGEAVRHTAFEFQAQQLERASLKFTIFNHSNEIIDAANARLLGADSYWIRAKDQPVQIKPIRTAREREAAFVDLTNALPSLGLSVGAFVLKTNPLRTPSILSASFVVGENHSEIVTTRAQTAGEPTVVHATYTLDAASGALRTLESRIELENTTVRILTEFEAPIPNWKGSQEATDEAVYNWEVIAALLAEDEAINDKPQVSVEPMARAAFERAATLYRGLNGLHLSWKKIETDEFGEESATAALDYERDERLRLQYPGLLASLVVVDDAHKWTLQSELMNPDGPPHYQQLELADDDKSSAALVALMTSLSLPRAMSEFLGPGSLHSLNPLVVSAQSHVNGFVSLEAKMLGSQEYDGEVCDLVQIVEVNRTDDAESQKQHISQSVHWFARSDGRLMRLQEGFRSGDSAGSTTDSQITEQIFNPTFAPDTFKFVPPPGAVLRN